MPDQDRFERLLRGKGWRPAFRLAAGNFPMPVLVDSLMKAAAYALRNQAQSPSLSKIVGALHDSLNLERERNRTNGIGGLEGFEHLTNALDQIEADDIGYVGTQVARKAAEKVFVEQSRRIGAASVAEIQDRFGEVFVTDLVDQQYLSRVRTGIAERNNRSVEQQVAWEGELRENLKPQARKLFRSAAKAKDTQSVRAPRSIAPRAPSIEIQLHEPLVPLQR